MTDSSSAPVFVCNRFTLALTRPLIMGIVNVTPDSFSDGGQFSSSQQAIEHAAKLVEQGADILDIGGESTRPGAEPVSPEQELDRVMPVLEGVLKFNVPVSIDTRRPQVMREAITAGVDLLNDVNGFRDEDAFLIAGQSKCGLCIMHMQGEPRTMQQQPQYQDVVAEVLNFLIQQRDRFLEQGVERQRILIDPGFGFGKTFQHNLALLRAIGRFAQAQPTLVGVSRKTMIASLLAEAGKEPPAPADRVAGSVAAALWAADQGAQILRVHDVLETAQALKVWQALRISA
jgi:dihydropteroate synthase